MKISGTQKVIQIGSSVGITLPAKEAKKAGIKVGGEVNYQAEPVKQSETARVSDEYEAFKAQYSETLKNLADR